jgi:hypothetical protein
MLNFAENLIVVLALALYFKDLQTLAAEEESKKTKRANLRIEADQAEDSGKPKRNKRGKASAEADEADMPKRTKSGKKVVDVGEAVVLNSSEYHREGKKAYIALELFGLNLLPSSGFIGGAYISPDTIVDASFTTGQFDFLGYKMKSNSVSFRYKKFNGNSFYWRSGIMMRQLDYNTTLSVLTDGPNGKATASSAGVDLAIGNQWQWQTFTIGCDWIGLFAPAFGSSRVSRPAGATDEWYNKQKKDAESLAKRGSPQWFRFYLGVSF